LERFAKPSRARKENAVYEFIAKHEKDICGVLSGFDRLVFRGTLRSLASGQGMDKYLGVNHILLKEFGNHAKQTSERLKQASLAEANRLKRPVNYLNSSRVCKEEVARQIAKADGIKFGLVCVLTCVEPCQSFEIHQDRATRHLEIVSRERKCLFLYHYWIDPEWGFMHGRIQTWYPFSIQICINGREWLAQQMRAAGIKYVQQGNCFPWVADWNRAQQLLEAQLQVNWARRLDSIGQALNPVLASLLGRWEASYYWSVYQSEWAIDIIFRDPKVLRRLYQRLLQHGITHLGTLDVMKFLGRRLPLNGQLPKRFNGQAVSDLRTREEGTRLKFSINGNSLKAYDKAYTPVGSDLRGELTMTNPGDFRVYRAAEGNPKGPKSWRRLRRGIADLHRRAEISRQGVERLFDALAAVDEQSSLEEVLQRLQQPRSWKGRRVRALRPFADDRPLLKATSRGEYALNGFRNRDLRAIFFPTPTNDQKEGRRRSGWVSRKLRMLRAHGLIRKISRTHRYMLTQAGRTITAAITAALNATLQQLTAAA
jgi:hypothetical protein